MTNTKTFIAWIGFCLILHTLSAQNKIEKAIVKDNRLYILESIEKGYFIGVSNPENSAYLRAFDLQKQHNPIYIDLFQPGQSPIYGFPHAWDIFDNKVYTIAFAEGGNRVRPSFSFYKLPLTNKDTFEIVSEKSKERNLVNQKFTSDSIREVYWLEKSEQEEKSRNSRYVMPLLALIESGFGNTKIKKGQISYDFDIQRPSSVLLYVRDDKQLSIWTYQYPVDPDIESKNEHWNHQITYTNQSNLEYLKKHTSKEFFPDKNRIRLNTISDSLFHDGHIKVINQNNKTYIINLKHGGIYYLEKDIVLKIGQIILQDPLLKLSARHFFIQDIDRDKLIFFAPVKFFGNSESIPSYHTILEKEEIKAFFRYHNIY